MSDFHTSFLALRSQLLAHAALAVRGDADDLVQDLFVLACKLESSYDPRQPLRAWLVGLLNNLIRAHCRKRRRETTLPDTAWQQIAATNAPTRADLYDLALFRLRYAPLSPIQAVCLRRRLDGHSSPAIAMETGLSVRTVQAHIQAAVALCRDSPADAFRSADLDYFARRGPSIIRYQPPQNTGSALAREALFRLGALDAQHAQLCHRRRRSCHRPTPIPISSTAHVANRRRLGRSST